jgi:hypothetical protein
MREASPNQHGDPSVAGKRSIRVTQLSFFTYRLFTLNSINRINWYMKTGQGLNILACFAFKDVPA